MKEHKFKVGDLVSLKEDRRWLAPNYPLSTLENKKHSQFGIVTGVGSNNRGSVVEVFFPELSRCSFFWAKSLEKIK